MGARRQGRPVAGGRRPRRRPAARGSAGRSDRRRRPRLSEPAAPTPPPAPSPTERRRPDIPSWAVVFVLLALGFWLMMGALGGCLPSFSNPFREETVDRSSPVVLRAIEDLARFQAATGHFEVIVDVEKDTRYVPAVIRGERVLFVAVGDVDAGVDFSNLDEDAVDVSDDRRSVELTLPAAQFFGARIDPRRSYVYDRDRGLIDRVASLFVDNPTSERELYVLAEQKLRAAAQDDSGLLERAEQNTRRMLTGMLRALGFERIAITFVEPDR